MLRFLPAAIAVIVHASALSTRAEPADKPTGILLAAGDIAECKPGNPKGRPADGYRQQQTANLLGKEIADAQARGIPIRVLALGDLAYQKGSPDEFDNCFHNSWGKHIESILPVPGNHEYESTNAEPYFAYFKKHGKTMVSENSPAEGPKVGYYSLNFPAGNELSGETTPWRLIALDSGKETPSPSQLGWLEQDLKLNRQRCVLAFAHFFAFSSSRHGHEPPDFKHADKKNSKKEPKPDTNMVAVVQMLYSSGASLLLSGHDHGYEQFKRQDAAGKPAGDGVRAFVVGTGGATFYGETYEKKWPNSEKRQSRWHGVLKLELFETRYRWRFVPIDMIASKVPDDLKAPSEEECNSRKE